MPRYAAFLRGINVSGQKIIKMEALREMLVMPGIKNVVTYIQSGNIAFDSSEIDANKLRSKIEKKLEKDLGYKIVVIVRSLAELYDVIARNPFSGAAEARAIYVHFLADAFDADKVALFDAYKMAGEEIVINGCEVYLATEAYGKTKLSNTLIEKKLGTQATARNWNTVNKMATL